jgi:cyclic pyranopterin phosphate synthase
MSVLDNEMNNELDIDSDRITACMAEPNAAAPHPSSPLVDRFGRVHRALRISVTDVCNIRCQYCMPAEGAVFLPQARLLPFDRIERIVRIAAGVGIRKIRITGGEPLMRPRLSELIARLSSVPGIEDLAITTNGMLLAAQLPDLVRAGLQRINISLDTLNEATFKELARREGLPKVLEGIAATKGFSELRVRLNALILREVNFADVVPLAEFARAQHLALRFIEFMPLDAERAWQQDRVVTGEELRRVLSERYGPLHALPVQDASQPATDFRFADGQGTVGFIDSVTRPFCGNCDRLRLTAEGRLRNCLFGHQEWDLASALAETEPESHSGADDERVLALIRDCVQHKHAAHGIGDAEFQQPERAMYRIGG